MEDKRWVTCWLMVDPEAFGFPAGPPLPIPYLERDPEPGKLPPISRTPLTLVLGVLLTTSQSRPMFGPLPTNDQFARMLTLATPELKAASVDEMCVNAAAFLETEWGTEHAIRALRRACELLPDGTLCRGDLVMSLFAQASAAGTASPERLQEIANLFREWAERDTSLSANEAWIFYAGLGVLAALGLQFELKQWKRRHRHRIGARAWLDQEVTRLSRLQAGQLSEVLFPPGHGPGNPDERPGG